MVNLTIMTILSTPKRPPLWSKYHLQIGQNLKNVTDVNRAHDDGFRELSYAEKTHLEADLVVNLTIFDHNFDHNLTKN